MYIWRMLKHSYRSLLTVTIIRVKKKRITQPVKRGWFRILDAAAILSSLLFIKGEYFNTLDAVLDLQSSLVLR